MSSNLLGQESSPYLLLHKDNPVHWRPWGETALNEAESSGKAVLLSIGYSACHWCHVMNEESFADPETAALINELFVPVKVDREERPDVDQLYQTAAVNLGGGGGWPLTVFLTPKGEPFFAGTYYPKEERFGKVSFKTLLQQVAKIYKEQPEPVNNTINRVTEQLLTLWARDARGQLDAGVLDNCAINIGQRFDMFFGGLTGPMKFPAAALTENLWRAYLRTGALQFQQLAQTTLDGLCRGGIYDHVGGGWARYTVDERWIIPHFEKMLYDNAAVIDVLTLIWQSTRTPMYREHVEDTVGWLFREMRVEDGFASSLDADSEGEEGKYYTWTEAEIDAALMGTFVQRFKDVYNVTRAGNFHGKNVLHRLGTIPHPLPEADEALLKKQRELLLEARQGRTPPLRDDKVMADWNGMIIASLANAGAVFRKKEWTLAAAKAFDFVVKAMGDGDRLYHSWRAGRRGAMGFLDDYAQMARAALMLWETTAEARYFEHARSWVRVLDDHFWDMSNGGYFYTADDGEPLLVRARTAIDQAVPSANALMISVLAKMHFATMDPGYRDRANTLLQAFAGEVPQNFVSMATYLNSLETILASLQIVIVGPLSNPKTHELANAVWGRSLPNRLLVVSDPGKPLPEGHPAQGKTMQNGQPAAYICQRQTCSAPITNPVTLSQALQMPARTVGVA